MVSPFRGDTVQGSSSAMYQQMLAIQFAVKCVNPFESQDDLTRFLKSAATLMSRGFEFGFPEMSKVGATYMHNVVHNHLTLTID